MKIEIKYTNINSSDSARAYVEQKIGQLQKFINIKSGAPIGGRETVEARVELERTTRHHRKGQVFRAEAQINAPGRNLIRAESLQPDLYLAIDEVKDELQRQLMQYKDKQRSNRLRDARNKRM